LYPLCLSVLELNTKGAKVYTKDTKDIFNTPLRKLNY
jgi:hypothetical protein